MEKKTVKYHIPQHGIYMYARTNSGKTELIVLNSTDAEQVVANDHYRIMTNDSKSGKERKLPILGYPLLDGRQQAPV